MDIVIPYDEAAINLEISQLSLSLRTFRHSSTGMAHTTRKSPIQVITALIASWVIVSHLVRSAK